MGFFFINDININVFSFINCCELGFSLRTQRKRKLSPSLKLGMETWQRELHKKYDVLEEKKWGENTFKMESPESRERLSRPKHLIYRQ